MNKKYQKYCLIIFIIIFILKYIPVYAWSPDAGLSSTSAILMDTIRGQILYEKNSDKLFSPSIMSKLMTVLVTIEKTDLNAKVTISKNAAGINGASLKLIVGNKYTVGDLLYAVMLSPGNDAAVALAEYVGQGDVNKFVGYMNEKSKELGLLYTNFVNPTGLYDKNQYTSVKDIAKLVKSAISNPTFNIIFGAKGTAWENGNNSFIITSQNTLFWSYNGVDGGKVGTTPQQGTTAVTTATQNSRRLICVVLNDNDQKALEESSQLFDYGFTGFFTGLLVAKDTPVRNITIQNINIDLISKMDVYYTYPIGKSYIKNITYSQNEKLNLPISTDTIAGVLHYTLNDDTLIDINLYPSKEVKPPEDTTSRIKNIIKENKDLVAIVVFLLAVECILAIQKLIKVIIKPLKKDS